MVVSTALVAACTNPPPAGGFSYSFFASNITNVHFNGDWPPTFWDPDSEEEPYLVHLGLQLQVTPSIQVSTFVTSTYFNNGNYIGKVGPQQSLAMGTGDGLTYSGFQLPDLLDLGNGAPLQILGSVEFLFERDQLIPFGIAQVLAGVSQLINAALPTILANSGALPSDPQGILNFLGGLLPGIFASIGGILGAALGSITGGDPLIGLSPDLFIALGGQLGNFLVSNLPGLLQIIDLVLAQQNPNPFPNGLPFQLGVVGYGITTHFGDPALTSTYDVNYGWQQV